MMSWQWICSLRQRRRLRAAHPGRHLPATGYSHLSLNYMIELSLVHDHDYLLLLLLNDHSCPWAAAAVAEIERRLGVVAVVMMMKWMICAVSWMMKMLSSFLLLFEGYAAFVPVPCPLPLFPFPFPTLFCLSPNLLICPSWPLEAGFRTWPPWAPWNLRPCPGWRSLSLLLSLSLNCCWIYR